MATVDMALFELLTDGDREFAQELVEMWEAKTTEDIATLRTCVQAGDSDTLLKVAHSLKGASANLGAVAVQGSAKELEYIGRGGDLSQAVQVLSELVEHIEQARVVYQAYFTGASQ